MTPLGYYQKLLESDQILSDREQEVVIDRLEFIYQQLVIPGEERHSFLRKIYPRKTTSIQGLYLWGDVGIGKTFLMNCFFVCLPFKNKLRMHFHSFMKMIHERLNEIKQEEEPLLKIAKQLSKETRIICLDEIIITDIADAMLLYGLFEALYKHKICLIFTSNTEPDNLYLKGIQRESFLPAIDLIKKNTEVLFIGTKKDYRIQHFKKNNFYYTPLNQHSEEMLEEQFARLSECEPTSIQPLLIDGRVIPIKKATSSVVWFDFIQICGVPRSQTDYLMLAKQYHTILISGLRVIKQEQNDLARAFINLVDVLYDANIRLIISAEKSIDQIYYCGKLLFEFARTKSRLIEMQTASWPKIKPIHNGSTQD